MYIILLLVACHLFLLYLAWLAFWKIPEKQYKAWFLEQEKGRIHIPMLKGLPVRLRVRRHYSDIREEEFTVIIPDRIKIGKLFYHFVLDQQKDDPAAIECEDEQQRPYGWQFYTSGYGGASKRILDPEKTLSENKLNRSSTILAQRVKGRKPTLKNRHS